MRLTAILIIAACLQINTRGFAQTVTLSLRNTSLERVFKEVKKQTGYSFIYTRELLAGAGKVSIELKGASLQQVLDDLFKEQPFNYSIQDKFIIIKPGSMPLPRKSTDAMGAAGNTHKIRVLGRVMDAGGEPLTGATVVVRGQGHDAFLAEVTNGNGQFGFTHLPNGSYQLEISFIGYERYTCAFSDTDKPLNILVDMKKSTSTLDAIQTTAYSKTSLRFNTGDVTTISSEEIARNPVPNVLEALQGRVPGMFVTQTTGKINGGFQVQIRSLNTLSAGTSTLPTQPVPGGQPLYIVDGVEYPANGPLPMANVPGLREAFSLGNALNYLDPSLIESINILKGADATSIYGSRGAFGVILLATKKAKPGQPSLTINAVQGIATMGVTPRLLNLPQYLALRRNAFANDSVQPGPMDYDVNGAWDTTKGTDWKKFFFGRHASTTRANATYTGGTANSNYLLGVVYSSIGDIQRSKGSVRQGGVNFSLNTATNDRKLTMALSGSYITELDNTVPFDFSGDPGLFAGSQGSTQAPDAPYPYLPNGQLNWAPGTTPPKELNLLYRNNTDNFIANTNLTVTPVAGLSFSAVGGFNLITAKEFVGKPSSFFNPATFTPSDAYSKVNLYRIRTLSADPRAEYIHTWGKARLDVIAGLSLRDLVTQRSVIAGSGFASDQLLMNPAAGSSVSASYSNTPQRYIGGFATINFRWADKYILNLNGRRDGSSVFGNDRQFGNFGSVAGAWIVSEEPWFKGLRGAVDFLKLKASYGLVGSSAIPPYSYLSSYVTGYGYSGAPTLVPQSLANPYLHWETNRNFEVGLNVDLFRGRVNVEAIYYSDRAGDQLVNLPLATITGFSRFLANSPAVIRSYGAEFYVSTRNIRDKDFSWTTRINLTIPRTKLLAYPGVDNLVGNFGLGNYTYVIGKPITGIKLFRYAGVDPATGNYNFYNAAGQKGEFTPILSPVTLNQQVDRNVFVDRAPKWYGGILNSLSYKNFSMDFLVTVTKRVGPSYLASLVVSPGPAFNIPVDLANKRWMKPGDVTTVPKATQGIKAFLNQNLFQYSTGAFSDATYARLQNLSVTYRLPARLIRNAHLSTLSVYVAGQNLLTVSKYGGLDPETMSTSAMPPLRIFTGGLTIGF
ncbi:MAG TPA: SusC/RagA family TonB-linked outer membrane protein [Puia sp.]|nr:SusC/RagA family TonB-linked outer membrane protein [Puia sp.]